jgi:serine/threonine-protein kinase ULK/ATG1
MVRRTLTQQGSPTSTTGAIPATPSRATQVAQGKIDFQRPGSYDKNLAGSPGSAASYISKAIQDASLRLFGFKYSPHVMGKGASPPQLYSPFPAYPTPATPVGLIGDGKQTAPVDEDSRVAQCIEDYATRSDVVYGFAEVKYKQLVPMAPSVDHGLGGVTVEGMSADDDGLTPEAIVALSEEALVLYVKALSLLAKSMDIASLWWSHKSRSETGNGNTTSARESTNSQTTLSLRINAAVQWIRARFNEVLEKAEVVRLKLIEAQKQLPEDHPSHPSNRAAETTSGSSSSAEGVFLTPGISAEKLMYDRALEMSRAAAINEIANEDLPGCEISYITAIRMLEAVLDHDDDLPRRRPSASARDEKAAARDEALSDMNQDDQQAVQKGILAYMATSPFASVPLTDSCFPCSDSDGHWQTRHGTEEDAHDRNSFQGSAAATTTIHGSTTERRRNSTKRTIACFLNRPLYDSRKKNPLHYDIDATRPTLSSWKNAWSLLL